MNQARPPHPQAPAAPTAQGAPSTPDDFAAKHPKQDLSEHKPLTFPTQRPNERVILLLRRHWTVLARDISQLIMSLLLPPIVIILLMNFTPISLAPGTATYVLVVQGLSLYYLFSFLAYFHDFVDYHLDIWVVTDQRIVSIEQEGLFHRTVSELNIVKVQDVTSEIKGKVQTFLDYGQVHIQTAGEQERFLFEQVPHPSEVAKVILQVHDRTMKIQDLQKIREEEEYRQQMELEGQVPVEQYVQQRQVQPGQHHPQAQRTQFQPTHQPTSQAPAQVRRVAHAPQPTPQAPAPQAPHAPAPTAPSRQPQAPRPYTPAAPAQPAPYQPRTAPNTPPPQQYPPSSPPPRPEL